jgi:hypothetical protein
MHITYGVYNPSTGVTHTTNTKEEALQLFTTFLIKIAKECFHNTMYITMENNDDGTITCYSDGNVVKIISSLAELEQLWIESETA